MNIYLKTYLKTLHCYVGAGFVVIVGDAEV
jgi:hypothetical protein